MTYALLIVDMINDFRFDDGEKLFQYALPAAERIAELKPRAARAGAPVVYVNDNFKRWHDTFETTIKNVKKNSDEGRRIVSVLRPEPNDYYILKPHWSGFYKTPLGVLLEKQDVSRLIITGIATDICVLATAQDAFMRGFKVNIPKDCTAAHSVEFYQQTLDLLRRNVDADLSPSTSLFQ